MQQVRGFARDGQTGSPSVIMIETVLGVAGRSIGETGVVDARETLVSPTSSWEQMGLERRAAPPG
jgi:hypothetical protein